MKILGFEHRELLYDFVGVIMGVGAGIMLTNMVRLSIKTGLAVFIISFCLSIFIWNKQIRKGIYMQE